ncbi:hypothetical protein KBC04_02585 [Candidatus Babeliales bacterium]|nr:hypothetical protein [Candidatus Babeliales bacterium]MBP9844061.1 hypothetical protein [Candidatus Babeliales bacterium]
MKKIIIKIAILMTWSCFSLQSINLKKRKSSQVKVDEERKAKRDAYVKEHSVAAAQNVIYPPNYYRAGKARQVENMKRYLEKRKVEEAARILLSIKNSDELVQFDI